MISLLLLAWAFDQEAKMDRLYECFKLLGKEQQETFNKVWDSYNPMAPARGPWGIRRDGWHWAKWKHLCARWAATILLWIEYFAAAYLLSGWVPELYIGITILIEPLNRHIVFNRRLAHYRRIYTAENRFQG